MTELRPIDDFRASQPEQLVQVSLAEGYDFVWRMLEEWDSGKLRFDAPGERLLGAFDADVLVGVCGLCDDPYTDDSRIGRIRHMYVLPAYRGTDLGRRLLEGAMAEAEAHYVRLRLRAVDEAVGNFYVYLGFTPCAEAECTHAIEFD